MSQLLLIGNDERLQTTRAAILNLRWPSSCASPQEALRSFQTSNPDLLILCHTLSLEEAKRLVGVCRNEFPQMRILALEATNASAHDLGADATIPSMSPPAMLKVIEMLLDQSHSQS